VPRQPLWAGNIRIGSVAPALFQRLASAGMPPEDLGLQRAGPASEAGWQLPPDPTGALLRIGQALGAAGLVAASHPEWLHITGPDHQPVGSVQRGLARLLGLTTHSVHLVGLTDQGHCWVQQRAPSKAEDPGMWDTLVGGTQGLGETPGVALERELWEEAGLRPAQLSACLPCGEILVTQARGSDGLAFQVEHIRCFVSLLTEGLEPRNQDGEVIGFDCLAPTQLVERLQAGLFTLEAACVLLQVQRALGAPGSAGVSLRL
jgi:8-oxo-dGTP pyrophosphatase MutT (NUDIX family)